MSRPFRRSVDPERPPRSRSFLQLPAPKFLKDSKLRTRHELSEMVNFLTFINFQVLIKKLKNQMDKATFQEFHREADVFLRQSLSAEGFHARLVDYGLAHYIAEIANLCPSAAKRSELLDVHSKFLQQCKQVTQAPFQIFLSHSFRQDPAHAPAFVPVSVLEASFRQAMEKPTWMCPRCSTLNMADADFCEACDAAHGAHPLRPERIPPSPIVYRKSPAQQRMLFGVDDRKQGSKAWNKRSR